MNPALYSDELPRGAHRLLWWLLAHQEKDDRGIATGIVPSGWRDKAIKELSTSRVSLWRMQSRLRDAKIIEFHPRAREVRILGEAFN